MRHDRVFLRSALGLAAILADYGSRFGSPCSPALMAKPFHAREGKQKKKKPGLGRGLFLFLLPFPRRGLFCRASRFGWPSPLSCVLRLRGVLPKWASGSAASLCAVVLLPLSPSWARHPTAPGLLLWPLRGPVSLSRSARPVRTSSVRFANRAPVVFSPSSFAAPVSVFRGGSAGGWGCRAYGFCFYKKTSLCGDFF